MPDSRFEERSVTIGRTSSKNCVEIGWWLLVARLAPIVSEMRSVKRNALVLYMIRLFFARVRSRLQ
jgi:hypothetical protein